MVDRIPSPTPESDKHPEIKPALMRDAIESWIRVRDTDKEARADMLSYIYKHMEAIAGDPDKLAQFIKDHPPEPAKPAHINALQSEGSPKDNPHALPKLAQSNQVLIIADADHEDGNISTAITRDLAALKDAGVKHLYLEHDSKQCSVQDLAKRNDEYGEMVREALKLGIQIHFYDDRSKQMARDANYPVESEIVDKNDYYRHDPQKLIDMAPDKEKMREYLKIRNESAGFVEFRNGKMIENLDHDMKEHPNEKAVVRLGAGHLETTNDVDEGLRRRGYQVVTAEILSDYTASTASDSRLNAADKPDFTIKSETGDAIAYKIPGTNEINPVRLLLQGVELPWKNTEPVKDMSGGGDTRNGLNINHKPQNIPLPPK